MTDVKVDKMVAVIKVERKRDSGTKCLLNEGKGIRRGST